MFKHILTITLILLMLLTLTTCNNEAEKQQHIADNKPSVKKLETSTKIPNVKYPKKSTKTTEQINKSKISKEMNEIMFCNISKGWLNIRKESKMDSDVVGKLVYGDKVKVLDKLNNKITLSGETGYWYLVSDLNSTKPLGWVFSPFLSPVPKPFKINAFQSYFLEVISPDNKTNRTLNAYISPSGKYIVIDRIDSFALIPVKDILSSGFILDYKMMREGYFNGFLPNDKLLYDNSKSTYILDPKTKKSEKLFSNKIGGEDVILSNKTIITLKYHSDCNIYLLQYDIQSKKIVKEYKSLFGDSFGCRANGKSSSKKYFLFECGDEETNDLYLYDTELNTISNIVGFMKLKENMSMKSDLSISYISFLENQNQLLVSVSEDSVNNLENWLLLLDLEAKTIIWKTQLKDWIIPTFFNQIDEESALFTFANEKKVYLLNLLSGDISLQKNIEGDVFSVNHKKDQISYIKNEDLYICSIDGSNKKKITSLYGWEYQSAYKGMGDRPPLWSPNGDFLIIFGKAKLKIIKVDQ